MLPDKLAFVDIETTGTSFNQDRVIEIGILQSYKGKLVSKFESLINPGSYVPAEILHMTGISGLDLDRAPTFRQVADQIYELLEGQVFVAHNARFDYGFIKNEFKQLGESFSAKCLCTVKLAKALYPLWPSHNLDTLIFNLGIKCANRHRAFADAKVMWDFVKKAQKEFSSDQLTQAVKHVLKRPSIPVGISHEALDKLPETAGVYIFYAQNGMPLYVGKSINIRERVLSHFSASSLSSFELKISTQIKSIETINTEGELGALLKESQLIKQLQPSYNRKLRHSSQLVYLGSEVNSQDVKTVTISNQPSEEILGVFKTQKQLKEALLQICEKNTLCQKLLGLEKSKASCFGYQIGKCKGACVGHESPRDYNLRFDLAFIASKIKSWPFPGAVVITEGNDRHIVNQWRYVGVDTDEPSSPLSTNFDLDTYKILSRYLLSDKNQSKIRNFSGASTD